MKTKEFKWSDYKIADVGHPCHTIVNLKDVAEDRDNLFMELPFWLRIGPISWHNVEAPNGWMLGFNDYDDD